MTKIMLVEDDKALREIYSIRLVAEGYNVVSAGDGEEALAMAVRENPDLIVSDVMMPKISGFDMLDIIRSTPETKNIKVIMMTALSTDDQRKRGESLGADRYLVKSQVGIEDVVNAVHEVLGDRPSAAALQNINTLASLPVAPAAQPAPAAAPPAPTPQPAPVAPAPQPQPQSAPTPAPEAPAVQPAPIPQPAPQATPPPAPVPQPAPAVHSVPIQMADPTPVPVAPATQPAPVAPAPQPQPQSAPTPAPEAPAVQSAPIPQPAPAAAPPSPTPQPAPQPAPEQPSAESMPQNAVGERVIQPINQPDPSADAGLSMEERVAQELADTNVPAAQ